MANKKVQPSGRGVSADWTLLGNHALVLLCLAANPNLTLRHVAEKIGVTERSVQRIVGELVAAGYLSRRRAGRQNCYQVHGERAFRHPLLAHRTISRLLRLASDISPQLKQPLPGGRALGAVRRGAAAKGRSSKRG